MLKDSSIAYLLGRIITSDISDLGDVLLKRATELQIALERNGAPMSSDADLLPLDRLLQLAVDRLQTAQERVQSIHRSLLEAVGGDGALPRALGTEELVVHLRARVARRVEPKPAVDLLKAHHRTDGEHHRTWIVAQALRALMGDVDYKAWRQDMIEDNADPYNIDGRAPC